MKINIIFKCTTYPSTIITNNHFPAGAIHCRWRVIQLQSLQILYQTGVPTPPNCDPETPIHGLQNVKQILIGQSFFSSESECLYYILSDKQNGGGQWRSCFDCNFCDIFINPEPNSALWRRWIYSTESRDPRQRPTNIHKWRFEKIRR